MTTLAQTQAYLRHRADGVPAKVALRWAKEQPPDAFDWEDTGDKTVGIARINGWDLTATIEDEDYWDFEEEYGTAVMARKRYADGAFENPYFREWHRGKYDLRWHDDTCGARHDSDGAARWFYPPSGDTLDEIRSYLSKQGVARGEAYARALKQMRDDAATYRKAVNGTGDRRVLRITVAVAMCGELITANTMGGYSWEREYGRPLDPQLDAIVAEVVHEALHDAPRELPRVAEELRLNAGTALRRSEELMAAAAREGVNA